MNDSFINAINTQKATVGWMDSITENMVNVYTPGYRENQTCFKTFLDSTIVDSNNKNQGQGKSTPGTSAENVFLEGAGYFTLRREDGRLLYTRLGEFTFDSEGVYKAKDGSTVQGYILNDKGEIMQGSKTINSNVLEEAALNSGQVNIPTTNIKLWIDPNNGKYLGKYDEYEFAGDGILYGKADSGKTKVPLYKLSLSNFHNPEGLFEYKSGIYVETEKSGPAVVGRGEVRGGLLELSNADLKANIAYYQQGKMQMELANKLISSYKSLLEEALRLVGE